MADVLIKMDGEVDLARTPEFMDQVVDALGHGAEHITFDLEGVTFMDSSALGVVITAARECDVTVINAHPHIRRSFEITGIDHLIGDPQ